MQTKDVVYIFRKGRQNSLALRLSLRSLVNVPHRDVIIVGDLPEWVDNTKVKHFPCNDSSKSKTLNAWNKLKFICEQDISEDIILFNDDFYVMKPIDSIPYYHRGEGKLTNSQSGYFRQMDATFKLFNHPFNYENHVPFIYNRKMFLDLYNHYDISKIYLHRSLYGNHYNLKGEYLEDCKYRRFPDFVKNINRIFLSSNDKIENHVHFYNLMNSILTHKDYETTEHIHQPVRRRGQHVLPLAVAKRKPQRKHPRAPLPISSKAIKRGKKRLR